MLFVVPLSNKTATVVSLSLQWSHITGPNLSHSTFLNVSYSFLLHKAEFIRSLSQPLQSERLLTITRFLGWLKRKCEKSQYKSKQWALLNLHVTPSVFSVLEIPQNSKFPPKLSTPYYIHGFHFYNFNVDSGPLLCYLAHSEVEFYFFKKRKTEQKLIIL